MMVSPLLLNSSSLLLDSWTHNDSTFDSDVLTEDPSSRSAVTRRHLSTAVQAIITASYVLGVVGNAAALLILSREGRRASSGVTTVGRNASKHALMLRCLLCNDLVALLGMLVLMHLQLYLPPALTGSRAFCAARVTMRLFGLGSGVVTLVMAAERWLALSHPFFYQKHVTYHMIGTVIFALWSLVVFVVSMPLFGFGIYYDPSNQKCMRYRQATDPVGIAYAYVYFTFGSLLCLVIVWFNLAVRRSLYSISRHSLLDRRVSSGRHRDNHVNNSASYRSLAHQSSTSSNNQRHNSATHEELAFARLMAALSVIFIVCWMPQMIAIPLSQFVPKSQPFLRAADILMVFHFTLDPYIYVLFGCRRRPWMQAILKFLFRPLRSNKGSIRSLPTTNEVQISLHDASKLHSPSVTSSDHAVSPSSHIRRQQDFL